MISSSEENAHKRSIESLVHEFPDFDVTELRIKYYRELDELKKEATITEHLPNLAYQATKNYLRNNGNGKKD